MFNPFRMFMHFLMRKGIRKCKHPKEYWVFDPYRNVWKKDRKVFIYKCALCDERFATEEILTIPKTEENSNARIFKR